MSTSNESPRPQAPPVQDPPAGANPRGRSWTMRRRVLSVLGLAALVWMASGLWAQRNAPPRVKVRMERRALVQRMRELGVVVARNETHVFSPFTGEIVWKMEEGERVEPETSIVRFDASVVQTDVEHMQQDLFEKEEAVRRAQKERALVEQRYELEGRRQKAGLESAQVDRTVLLRKPDDDQRREAELTLEAARLSLEQSTRDYEAHRELCALGFVTETVVKQKNLKRVSDKAEHAKAQILHGLTLQGATADSKRLAELAVADAEKNLAAADFNRDADRIIARANEELAAIDLDNFKMTMDLKKRELENAEVKAPVAGRVAYVEVWKGPSKSMSPIQIGESRSRGQDLCKVVDTSVLRVKTWINESDVSRLHTGQTAEVRLAAFPEKPFQAKVAEIALVALDKNVALSGLAVKHSGEAFVNVVQVVLDFEHLAEVDRQAIRLGFTAEVEIEGSSEEVPALPWTAVHFDPSGRASVEIAGAFGQSRSQEVKLGRSDAFFVEILEGLPEAAEVMQ